MAYATVGRRVAASPEDVFAVLADGWLYPAWVVGAAHMRDVDAAWPAEGAVLHHAIGGWPLLINDRTWVTACQPPHRLDLKARLWPAGEAVIALRVTADGDGTLVTMKERATSGVGRLLRDPLSRRMLAARNRESLARLAAIAEHRHARDAHHGDHGQPDP
jgi:hypothetical protein